MQTPEQINPESTLFKTHSPQTGSEAHPLLAQLNEALPAHFDFYHLGTVDLEPQTQRIPTRSNKKAGFCGTRYLFSGDQRASLTLLWAPDADPSMYAEIGNIIVGRMSTYLQKHFKMNMIPSIPEFLNTEEISQLSFNSKLSLERILHATFESQSHPLCVIIQITPLSEIGNA